MKHNTLFKHKETNILEGSLNMNAFKIRFLSIMCLNTECCWLHCSFRFSTFVNMQHRMLKQHCLVKI